MNKFFTKPIITFLMIIYCLVNFATFSSASVCVASDHVGLNLFGIDACCIARHHVEITEQGQVSLKAEDCSDQSISSNCIEIIPDVSVPLYVSDYATVAVLSSFKNYQNIKFEQIFYNDKQARPPDVGHLDRLRTVRLTI